MSVWKTLKYIPYPQCSNALTKYTYQYDLIFSYVLVQGATQKFRDELFWKSTVRYI
jgi:hypothetical protein